MVGGVNYPQPGEISLAHNAVLDEESNKLIKNAMDRLGLSARAYDRILKVARTVADLEGEKDVQSNHLSEAIHYRSLDRENWGG